MVDHILRVHFDSAPTGTGPGTEILFIQRSHPEDRTRIKPPVHAPPPGPEA